jgi:hypothetical protein
MMADKKKVKASTSREAVETELVAELRHLRAAVRDAGESFILRAEGEIETVISNLAAVPTPLLKGRSPGWLHEIRALKLKPAKGRLKDLKVIDRLIEELASHVMEAQEGKKAP